MDVDSTPADDQATAGVPLGGIGAGCIEMGPDGVLRNITINNNRTRETRIPVWDKSFIVVRAAQGEHVQTRILQSSSSLPFEEAGLVPPYTPTESMDWLGLYPCAHYRLLDESFPVEVSWTVMSPIIPYDVDASSMPIVFFTVFARNRTPDPVEFSVLLNWENINGCTADRFPQDRGPIRTVLHTEENESGKPTAKSNTNEQAPKLAGLEFGTLEGVQSNADGHYALLAKRQEHVDNSVMTWCQDSPDELRVFWDAFHDTGRLPNLVSQRKESNCGAVAATCELRPNKGRSFVFLLSWYCPRYEADGVNQSNDYCNRFASALDVASYGLKHYRYFFDAVEEFHMRLRQSSLPLWFIKLLINCNSVLSTNTIYTREKRFAMFESPALPQTGCMSMRLYSSLATLVFFPDLERREIEELSQTLPPEIPGRVYNTLGVGSLSNPRYDVGDRELHDVNAKFILLVYRDFFMTGRNTSLDALYPKVQEAVRYVMAQDVDGDALPEPRKAENVFVGWPIDGLDSYTAGLWAAALVAATRIAQYLRKEEDARVYGALSTKARRAFEDRFWNADGGFYRYSHSRGDPPPLFSSVCHDGQLAGQWYADFLGLGALFDPEHVRRALDTIHAHNERPTGVVCAVSTDGEAGLELPDAGHAWPFMSSAHYGCLQISRGNPDDGLYVLQRTHKNLFVKDKRQFDRPLRWSTETNAPVSDRDERHMSGAVGWHTLFALQGFFLNVPEQVLWLRPNLPEWVDSFNVPLLTPICWGLLNYYEERVGEYEQYIRLAFDGPIHVKTVVLRIPSRIRNVTVQCVSPAGAERALHKIWRDGSDCMVSLLFESPVLIGAKTTIILKEAQAPPARSATPSPSPTGEN